MNAWEVLGLPVCLAVSPDEVEQSFRAASEGQHPDAGGEAGQFERLREARDLLKDDYRRLDAWLEVQGVAREHSGEISAEVGAMFARVSELTTGVDGWLAKGAGVSSGLGKALWQKEGFAWKSRLEEMLDEVGEWQQRLVTDWERLQQQFAQGEVSAILLVRGELGFLRKWKQQLQQRYGRLWEGLV